MNFIDRLICELDTGLRTVLAPVHAQRVVPFASTDTHVGELAEADRRQSIALMRVNHAGEVCAQALYQGQALVARKEETRELLERAAHEDRDDLLGLVVVAECAHVPHAAQWTSRSQLSMILKSWVISAVLASIAEAEQYFSADSEIARDTLPGSRPLPVTTK